MFSDVSHSVELANSVLSCNKGSKNVVKILVVKILFLKSYQVINLS